MEEEIEEVKEIQEESLLQNSNNDIDLSTYQQSDELQEEQFSEGGEVKNSSLILNWGSVITFFK